MKKFKLKTPLHSFDHEGMIIVGKRGGDSIFIHAKDLCETNKNIMTKKDIIDCMTDGGSSEWGYHITRLEPLEIIKITQLDYEMLKFVQKQGAKYICRDKDGLLNLSKKEPSIMSNDYAWWIEGECCYLDSFTMQLFQFVKWEDKKYYVIEDVLNNCEVIDDEKLYNI